VACLSRWERSGDVGTRQPPELINRVALFRARRPAVLWIWADVSHHSFIIYLRTDC
jgi:hypothetical protein